MAQSVFAAHAALAIAHLAAASTMLPSVHKASFAETDAPWFALVDDQVYYTPSSLLGLSQNLSHYFYTHGPVSALPPALIERQVAGNEYWHILHIPDEDPSPLMASAVEVSMNGDRRNSASSLMQLGRGQVFRGNQDYPRLVVSADYCNPLAANRGLLEAEKMGVSHITPDSVMGFLYNITQLGSRSVTHADSRHKAEDWVEGQFARLNGRENTCRQSFTTRGDSAQKQNIITHIEGHSPEDGMVILAAHYDDRPLTGPAPGANDNGSGVAAMLSALAALKKIGLKPRKSIYFVGLAAEETGTHGSQHLAEHLKRSSGRGLERIGCDAFVRKSAPSSRSFLHPQQFFSGWSDEPARATVLVLDEVGWATPKYSAHTINVESFDPTDSLRTRPVMDHIGSAFKIIAPHMYVQHNAHPYSSDHVPFLRAGFPAAMVINGDDGAYPQYHRSDDTPDKVSPDFLASVAQSVTSSIIRMAHHAGW